MYIDAGISGGFCGVAPPRVVFVKLPQRLQQDVVGRLQLARR